MLRLSKARGTKVPKSAANTITHKRLIPTVMLRLVPKPSNSVVKKIIAEHMIPLNSPTLSSFVNCPRMFEVFKLDAASPCTTIADDWTPTLPPIAAIKGINRARAGLLSMSNAPITYAPPIPPPRPIKSHGRRALVNAKTESLDSTSSDIPDAS